MSSESHRFTAPCRPLSSEGSGAIIGWRARIHAALSRILSSSDENRSGSRQCHRRPVSALCERTRRESSYLAEPDLHGDQRPDDAQAKRRRRVPSPVPCTLGMTREIVMLTYMGLPEQGFNSSRISHRLYDGDSLLGTQDNLTETLAFWKSPESSFGNPGDTLYGSVPRRPRWISRRLSTARLTAGPSYG
jgi:hypothetical protein